MTRPPDRGRPGRDRELQDRLASAAISATLSQTGDALSVLLDDSPLMPDEPARCREAIRAVGVDVANAVLDAIRPGDVLSGDLVASVDLDRRERVGPPPLAPFRVDGYEEGVLPSERIDEIYLPGPVHLEMLDERSAYLGIGDNQFLVCMDRGRLVVRCYDSSFDRPRKLEGEST